MSDDPNAGLPVWVNIVVPILCVIVFVLVLVALYFTKREVSIETLEDWVEGNFVLRKLFGNKDKNNDVSKRQDKYAKRQYEHTRKNKSKDSNTALPKDHHTENSRTNTAFTIDRYDSIASIRTYGTLESQTKSVDERVEGEIESVSGTQSSGDETTRLYRYTSQRSVLSFESNV